MEMHTKRILHISYCIRLFYIACCLLAFGATSVPSVSAEGGAANKTAIETIQKNQTHIQDQKHYIQSVLNKHEASGDENIPAEEQLDLLGKIDFIYTEQLSALKNSVEIDQKIEQLQSDPIRAVPAKTAETSAPLSFITFDKLLEDKIILQEDEQSIKSSIHAAEELLEYAKENLATCEKNRRRTKEDVSFQGSNATNPSLVTAELRCRLYTEEVKHNEIILQNNKKELKLNQLKLATIGQKIAEARSRVIFSDENLQDQILEIDKNARELEDMLERAKAKKELQYARWAKAKEELDTHFLSPEERPKKEQEVQTWKVLSDTRRLEVEVLNNRLKRLADLKKVWQQRFSIFNNTGIKNLRHLLDECLRTFKFLKREKQLQTAHKSNVGNKALQLEQELKAAKESSQATWFIETQITAFRQQLEHLDQDLKSIQTLEWACKKLQSEIQERLQYRSFGDRLAELQNVLSTAWNYELTSAEDFSITVGKIITALFFLIAGYFVSRYLTVKAANQIKRRFNLDEAAAIAIQTIAHYCLLIMIVFSVLNMVKIPLTFFTVIGGALAIGVGFGSQNIVNNFLSGLILMAERPVKIGDIVEVEGSQGTVEMIGARSARIKTFDNLRLVVPNSTLLQNALINWSLADDIVRREIIVGVQYGSPVELVEKLLRQAVSEHHLVQQDPEPIILFYDFGDNSLIFKIYLWISMFKAGMKHQNLLQVESRIRFRIEALFRENNIVIAYPQRDVHLDAAKPLMIKIDPSGASNQKI